MSPPVRVRTATAADLDAIVDRWRELIDAHAALEPVLYAVEAHAASSYRAFVRRQLDAHRGLVLVADRGDARGVGYLMGGVGRRAPVYTVREVGMVFDLAVRPDLRGQGVGSALVDVAVERFAGWGLDWVQVNFAPGNALAAPFWQARGFTTLLSEAYRPIR
ncbi:MAG: GNAT family N-acetyltransferase [Myxococcales bacterium]|nr:GNAT family N-acetyltransferase [Myxococcales bacterium]MCB9539516.1 GNAT family N-acetyltransferase [Myxococcales bacterium]